MLRTMMMTKLARLLSLMLALALTGTALGQGSGRLEASLVWLQGELVPDETATLGVVLDIEPRWHIQAGKGSGDEKPPYIATEIQLTLPEGWVAGKATWPGAHLFTVGTEFITGYDGRSIVAIPVDVPADAAPGEYDTAVKIGYQACDDRVCEMPTDTQISGAVKVVSAADRAPFELEPRTYALFEATLGEGFDAEDAAEAQAEADGSRFQSGHRVRVELTWYDEPTPGTTANLGIILEMEEGWHIQAGEGSGDEKEQYIATKITLDLPEGWSSDDLLWPAADEFVLGTGEFAETLAAYEGQIAVIAPITIPADAVADTLTIPTSIRYQPCDADVCERDRTLEHDGTISPLKARSVVLVEQTLARGGNTEATGSPFAPKNLKWWGALLLVFFAMGWMFSRTLVIGRRAAPKIALGVVAVGVVVLSFTFVKAMTASFPWVKHSEQALADALEDGKIVFVKMTANWCANCHVNERLLLADDELVALLKSPGVVPMKVDFSGDNPQGEALKDSLGGGGIPIIAVYHPSRDEPIVIRGLLASAGPVIDALHGEGLIETAGTHIFDFLGWQFTVKKDATLLILGLAFFAGFFLNFTPCVLPVVPLKILSIQAHAKDPKKCFALGFIFGLGIVAAFAALGVLIVGLIGGIEQMDWGEMYSIWWFAGSIGLIVGLMGLGMLGLFSIRLPQFVYMFNPQSDSASGSFFMGVFTAILSTPCTGPLLGATIAWLLLQTKLIAFFTFLVMGVGMAFPYVLLTAKPSWLERLPRTGPGSELIKQVMGLLLMAVAVFFIGVSVESFAGKHLSGDTQAASTPSLLNASAIPQPSLILHELLDPTPRWSAYTPQALQNALDEEQITVVYFGADWIAENYASRQMLDTDLESRRELRKRDVELLYVDLSASNPAGDALKATLGGGGIPLLAVYGGALTEPIVHRGPVWDTSPLLDALAQARGESTGN